MQSLKEDEKFKSQAGFTLVELAVVMIVIGLLIGGVLRGQEMISNAKVTATVTQIGGYDTASITFRDVYDAFPGDMDNPGDRIPTCAGICLNGGNGNGLIEDAPDAVPTPGGEAEAFFPHLSAAGLISGVEEGLGVIWGGVYPEAEIGGVGFHIGYTNSAVALGMNPAPRAGHYLALVRDAGAAPAPGITPSEAFRIDAKLDEGTANAGSVFSGTDPALGNPTDCLAAGGVDYNTAFEGDNCFLYLKMQQ